MTLWRRNITSQSLIQYIFMYLRFLTNLTELFDGLNSSQLHGYTQKGNGLGWEGDFGLIVQCAPHMQKDPEKDRTMAWCACLGSCHMKTFR